MDAETWLLEAKGRVPNNPRLPTRRYPAALRGRTPTEVRAHLHERDWTGTWRGVVYDYHHYHSHAHEALVVLSGHAELTLGGAGGLELSVGPGDVLLLPAGVSHCSRGHSPDFEVMGAYAAGRDWDICTPDETDPAWARARIAEVPDWTHEPA